jgi:hypothetical protein
MPANTMPSDVDTTACTHLKTIIVAIVCEALKTKKGVELTKKGVEMTKKSVERFVAVLLEVLYV